MAFLERHIWQSPITVQNKVCLYRAYVIRVLLYESHSSSMTNSHVQNATLLTCGALGRF